MSPSGLPKEKNFKGENEQQYKETQQILCIIFKKEKVYHEQTCEETEDHKQITTASTY